MGLKVINESNGKLSSKVLTHYEGLTHVSVIPLLEKPTLTLKDEAITSNLRDIEQELKGYVGDDTFIYHRVEGAVNDLYKSEKYNLAYILNDQLPKALNKKGIHLFDTSIPACLDLWRSSYDNQKMLFTLPLSETETKNIYLSLEEYEGAVFNGHEFLKTEQLLHDMGTKTVDLRKELKLSSEYSNSLVVTFSFDYRSVSLTTKMVKAILRVNELPLKIFKAKTLLHGVSISSTGNQVLNLTYTIPKGDGIDEEKVMKSLSDMGVVDVLLDSVITSSKDIFKLALFVDNLSDDTVQFKEYTL